MHEFELIRPDSLDECVDALGEHGEQAALIAGGTDLHILMQKGLRSPKYVIDTGGIGELRFIREDNGVVIMGPAAAHADVAGYPGFEPLPCLRLAAGSVGSPQIRNVATLGGNIANASPSGDAYPPLLALGAALTLTSARGEREVALAEFATGPGETVMAADEIITRISFERPPEDAYSDFVKVGLRNALAISVASAAVVARGDGSRITEIRIACGAVAPTAMRFDDVEEMVASGEPSAGLLDKVREAASAFCCPITDVRGTAEYRRHVTGVIVSRLVEEAMCRLTGYSREA